MLDGELWVPGLKFREISSLVRGQKKITDEQKQQIKLALFAARKPILGNEYNTSHQSDFTTPDMINYLDTIDYQKHNSLVKVT